MSTYLRKHGVPSHPFRTLISGRLVAGKDAAEVHLDAQRETLDDLEELEEIMAEMLQRQQSVEVPTPSTPSVLHF